LSFDHKSLIRDLRESEKIFCHFITKIGQNLKVKNPSRNTQVTGVVQNKVTRFNGSYDVLLVHFELHTSTIAALYRSAVRLFTDNFNILCTLLTEFCLLNSFTETA